MLERYVLPKQYKTGHEGVDEQHAHLFSMLSALVTLSQKGKGQTRAKIEADIHELMSLLFGYTRNHFQYEEHMMEKAAYPETEKHKNEHRLFSEKMGVFQERVLIKTEDKILLAKEMSVYIRDWLLKHVFDEDKRMVEFCLGKGQESRDAR